MRNVIRTNSVDVRPEPVEGRLVLKASTSSARKVFWWLKLFFVANFGNITLACDKPIYLTFDTGHMQPAEAIKTILDKHTVKASFFVANEKTWDGGFSLDAKHQLYFKSLAREGHLIASHTWQHWYYQNNVGTDNIRLAPWGKQSEGKTFNQEDVCAEINKPLNSLGIESKFWRAPGGRASAQYLGMAKQCGYQHVGWTRLLGDELNSDQYSNQYLLDKALRESQVNDVLLLHLGIWSRKEPLWPIIEPLIVGLKGKGFCFATVDKAKHLPLQGKY